MEHACGGTRLVRPAVRKSPLVAACLSFVLPGLGQAWVGAPRRGAILVTPIALLALVALGAWWRGAMFTVGFLLQPEVLVALLVVDLAVLVLRSAAIVDAFRLARRRWPEAAPDRVVTVVVVFVLAAGLFVTHAAPGYLAVEALDTVSTVFDPGAGGDTAASDSDPYGTPGPDAADLEPGHGAAVPPEGTRASDGSDSEDPSTTPAPPPGSTATVPGKSGSPAPVGSSGTTSGAASPAATRMPSPTAAPKPGWAADGRLNVLVVGGDAGPDRWNLRTDTLILVSVDVATGRAAMFGIPRNLYNVPLPSRLASLFPCRCFPRMLNDLYSYADLRPAQFPGGKTRGYLAVAATIEALTGVDLDGMVVADLRGFVQLVDALGGLDLTVKKPLYDSHYPLEDGSGWIEVYFAPGKHHLDGRMALAYARSRHQDSDYGRMARQQEVLLALRRQARPACLVPKVGQLAKIVRSSLWTNISVRDLPGLLELAARVDPRTVARFAFNPPDYREYLLADDVSRIRAVVRDVFEGPAPEPAPGSEPALDDSSC
jgi:LCP family protein required for cell wall assembly